MNTSKRIGQILLSFFTITIVFVGYLYYIGAGEPIEETLVDGQWVRYKNETAVGYPGEIYLGSRYEFEDGPYASPIFLAGEAQSTWFHQGTAYAELIADNGSVLWSGFVEADERHIYDMVVPFSTLIDVGDYTGEATFIVYNAEASENVPETADAFAYSYSASIIIAEASDDIEEIEEDVE